MKWLDKPEKHDFDAAYDYLSLVMPEDTAQRVVDQLREHGKKKLSHRKAKDILRAAGHDLLPENNKHVAADLKKVREGEALSPVLLVVWNMFGRLVIADGYHRVCASYYVDENTNIPCVLI